MGDEQIVHVVGVFFLLRQNALEHDRSEMHGHEFQAFFLLLRGRFHGEVILAARARRSAG
ncbi:MAG: hypothetical protein WAJ85_13285 [Candidatus Baltobacteraceae bacterium]|jgi:hypothetical protein